MLPVAQQLKSIERRIASNVGRIGKAFRIAIDARIAVGKCLKEAKSFCNHGKWIGFLKRCGLKERTTQEFMRFAAHEALIKRETHGRADLTVEAVRRMLPSGNKATGQDRETKPGNASIAGCRREGDRTLDHGNGATSKPERRCDATSGVSGRTPAASAAASATAQPNEPTTTAAVDEPTTEGWSGRDIVDLVVSTDTPGKAATSGPEARSDPETACRPDDARSRDDARPGRVANAEESPEVTTRRCGGSDPGHVSAKGSSTVPTNRRGVNDRDGTGEHAASDGTGGLQPGPAGSSPPTEGTSLEDLPLRDDLADPTIFDALVRLELKAKPHIEALEELLNADLTIRHHLESAEARAGSIAVLIYRLVTAPPCENWVLCWKCRGKGKTPMGKGCMICGCAGCLYG